MSGSERMRRLVLCALCALAVACSREQPPADAGEETGSVEVQLARVQREAITEGLEVSGVLQPLPGRDVKLGALEAGRVAAVAVSEGDAVKAGALLLRLEQTSLRDALAQAEAGVAQARAQRDLARQKLQNAGAAFDAGVAARQEVQDAHAGAVSAESALRSAEAAAATARNALAHSELRAPFDGRVAHVFVFPGELVDAGKPLVEVVNNQTLELRAGLSPQDAARVKVGMPAEVTVEGFAPGPLPGKLVAVSPVVDPVSGLVLVRIQVANPEGTIKAGTNARARIVLGQRKEALVVPRTALVPMQQGESAPAEAQATTRFGVEKVDDQGRVHRVPVVLGATADGRVEVKSGLAEGDRVVSEGAYALPDGTRVRQAPAPGGGPR